MTKEIMDKAGQALASARILLTAGDSDGATNRAYYAMFDAAIAALAWEGPSMRHRTPNQTGLMTVHRPAQTHGPTTPIPSSPAPPLSQIVAPYLGIGRTGAGAAPCLPVSICSAVPSRQTRSRRGARACAARERRARRTLVARQTQAVALSFEIGESCARLFAVRPHHRAFLLARGNVTRLGRDSLLARGGA